MKRLVFVLVQTFALSCFALTAEESRHLILRTGEDLNQETLSLLGQKNREEAFDWVLRHHDEAKLQQFTPQWLHVFEEFYSVFASYPEKKDSRSYRVQLSEKARKLEQALAKENYGSKKLQFDPDRPQTFDIDVHKIVDISGHVMNIMWLDRIITTKSPFTETMTLFWHSHFTTSFNKVNQPSLMLRQNALLRRSSLESFAQLLEDVTLDGAMLVYLDGMENIKGRPNYNYARELLELFTLGEGNYTETDVREVARALTGIRLGPQGGHFDPTFHDPSEKVILRAKGQFNYKHIISLLLRDERTALFVVKKFWRHFISPTPDEKIVKTWANAFRASNYDVKKLLRTMLTSDQFYAQENRQALIKSPVEFITSTFRIYNYAPDNYMRLVHQTRVLGQTLYRPPDVRGWLGGTSWITLSTWLIRQRHIKNLLLSKEEDNTKEENAIDFSPYSNRISDRSLASWKKQFQNDWKTRAAFLLIGKEASAPDSLSEREFLTELMTRPEFNLK